jgi:hypothetical protein
MTLDSMHMSILSLKIQTEELNYESNYRQSFHRFCGDLCEEILAFLPIDDKIRLECVSKQFQSAIIRSQNVFELSDNTKSGNNLSKYILKTFTPSYFTDIYIEYETLFKVLCKFKFINRIIITKSPLGKYVRWNLLNVINTLCHHIYSIEFDFDVNYQMKLFCIKFGGKIKEVKLICRNGKDCKSCVNRTNSFKDLCNKNCKISVTNEIPQCRIS